MEHARNLEPRLLKHARTNRAFIVVRDEDGRRRQITLGPAGSPEAQRRYHLELARWHARKRGGEAEAALLEVEATAHLTIGGAVARWLLHVEAYYRGSREAAGCRTAVHHLLDLFTDMPAAEFSPKMLKVVRLAMVRGVDPDRKKKAGRRRGWSRTTINQAMGRIRRCFKWLVSEEMVPATTYTAVGTIEPLRRGRGDARESPPTMPVSDVHVAATLPHLPPVVADMVRLQHLVGMRGSELCRMTAVEIDRSGSLDKTCWVFRPSHSKLSYRGRVVEYVLGPQAVAIVKRYLKADPNAPMFSPIESQRERHALMRERRKSDVPPSQLERGVEHPARAPGDRYTSDSYGYCVRRACIRAGVPPWSPHALRRAVATRVRAKFGIEAARVALAHETVQMAELYGHADLKLAADVAREIG